MRRTDPVERTRLFTRVDSGQVPTIGRMMTAPDQLADDELLARSFQWRLDASRGLRKALQYARELEAEVRRRFAQPTDRQDRKN